MFQITRRADYAVRIMLDLGAQPAGVWVPAQAVAQRMLIPRAFLHKITAGLVKAGLVATFPGPTGGLALARPAAEVSLLQVLEAIDGPICLNMCLRRPRECPRDGICPAHRFWGRLQASVVEQLRGARLDALVAEAAALAPAGGRTGGKGARPYAPTEAARPMAGGRLPVEGVRVR
jgi:Rrf2 family transcriptional regulator, iron-sulfur cluster assembly transcription factor